MRDYRAILFFLFVLGIFHGCVYYENFDDSNSNSSMIIPPSPQGLETVTEDGAVYLSWLKVTVPPVAYYKVYRSESPAGSYVCIGKTYNTSFEDTGLLNGKTYYYAVSCVSQEGIEGPLSTESIHDTPRPEKWGICLYDANEYPEYSALDVVYGEVVSDKNCYAGLVFFFDGDVCYFETLNDVWIQDMGYTDNFDEISVAPKDGWSNSGIVEAIEGHTYVMWTPENLFAKIRVKYVGSNYIIIDWGCQIDEGNPEIKK